MNVLAYTDRAYLAATLKVAAGADVLVSPPLHAVDVDPAWLSGYDALYLDLHGKPSSVYLWAGPGQRLGALALETVRASNLSGTVVFATTCYLSQTDFIEAFLSAGARAVIGGEGVNWGTRTRLSGAQQLAQGVLRSLAAGDAPALALSTSRKSVSKSWSRLLYPEATRDALAFRVWEREGERERGS